MQKKNIRIIILNYNGRYLLEKYLRSVVEAANNSQHNCGVSVIDNKSTDDSVSFLKNNFSEVDIYEAKENRVLCSFNEYLKIIKEEIVIFLNTDIKVDLFFVDPLIEHFEKQDILFVAPKELSMETGMFQGNLNKPLFRLGILSAAVKKENYDTPQYNISVHGGAFDRKKFLFLGGYDDLYLPGIFEDFDLCYRGWKHGWKGLYEPKSFYFHEGSASFNAEFGKKGKMILAWRNSFLFFWKNITSKRMIFSHFICIPALLFLALIRFKWEIIQGFMQALRMRKIALNRRKDVLGHFKISDEQIIKNSGF